MDEGVGSVGDAPTVWGEDESEAFAEFGRAMVPGREEIERTLLGLLPAGRDEPFLGVEIGTGAGWLSAAVLREFPEARMVGLDGSPQMLRKTGELLAPYGGRAELRPFRLEEPSWTEGLPPVRVFLSSLVLHHLDGPGKRELFARLFARLEPGGALLFADLMEPRTERARGHSAAAWGEEIRRRSLEIHGDARAHEFFERERWNIYEYPDPMDRPPRCPSSCAGWRKPGSKESTRFGRGPGTHCSAATGPPADRPRIHQKLGRAPAVQACVALS